MKAKKSVRHQRLPKMQPKQKRGLWAIPKVKRGRMVKVPIVDREWFEETVAMFQKDNPTASRDDMILLAAYLCTNPHLLKAAEKVGNITVPPGEYPIMFKGETH